MTVLLHAYTRRVLQFHTEFKDIIQEDKVTTNRR